MNGLDAKQLLCSALAGDSRTAFAIPSSEILSLILEEGLECAFLDIGGAEIPPGAARFLKQAALGRTMWELRHREVVATCVAELSRAGIPAILIKGTPLAYRLYPRPTHRPRADTDILVRPADGSRARHVLRSCGLRELVAVGGEVISYQTTFEAESAGCGHQLDVHWQINNSQLLARLFTFAELERTCVAVPALGSPAATPDDVHALLIACMHRATHKNVPYYVAGVHGHHPDRLAWLWDIRLLCDRLAPSDSDRLADLARAKGLVGATCDGIRAAQACFPAANLAGHAQALERHRGKDAASHYLEQPPLAQQWLDFRALGSARRQALYLKELFLPGEAYMRKRFGTKAPLALLYLRRAFGGVTKALGLRPGTRRPAP